ncbi:hypothetical protein SCATT_39340 [Streptantibioticus cattleyicolor NRRL 8057 = DSM 46488]|uniref:Uncharacterized protein n=1 Tax=Streptantibioticus cattleyicolor (strain ATCC 35852 / DSM 46488 / JCM 4925 / NBRC 14057 / NRRL 8057) TaxID=1003195 RepID=G8WSS0_STREN|nr:hypothetical protein SCATT_39340 [Streptantibioticus cattleyicolor NRRL 8057 = DSM 46488]
MGSCGVISGKNEKNLKMNEKQAAARAEEIVLQAVEGMRPKPRLEPQMSMTGKCLDPMDGGSEDRVQVERSYWLKDVPGSVAADLVKQARDAWVAHGYKVQNEREWDEPFPAVNMRTVPDDFWMSAEAGPLHKTGRDGLASITVTSPCFWPEPSPGASARSAAARRHDVLDCSSRVYDALRATAVSRGEDVLQERPDPDRPGTLVHHAWQVDRVCLPEPGSAVPRVAGALRDLAFQVRTLGPDPAAPSGLLARHPQRGLAVRALWSGDRQVLKVGVTGA